MDARGSGDRKRMPVGVLAGVRKVAVLRANGIGDFVFTLPALESLRAAYPLADIALLGRGWHADFLASRPGPIDRVIVIPDECKLGPAIDPEWNPQAVDFFFSAMREEGFDVVLQMQGGGRNSNPFVKRLGARLTAGSRTPQAEALDRWIPYRVFQRESLRHLEIVSLIGAKPVTLLPRLRLTVLDLDQSYAVVPRDEEPFAVLHPLATDSRRCWPAERFAYIGDRLAENGYRVVVNGTPPERDVTQAVIGAMRAPVVDLSGGISLRALLGLLARARIMVSNDSGPAHLAMAVGCPAVVLYWCGNYMTGGPMTCENYAPVISWRLDCPECGRSCMHHACGHGASFVADIERDEVMDAVNELLER